ncbi:GlxA family transcriptional regulator [Dongia deserti]|uniref:GlxA family transcriptional regulator n=1 Tax=Dongia deserti TaxID=2268030 RepID=UPI000E65544E|nr:GlxA family transcriptional regulator [Dongia deserti]
MTVTARARSQRPGNAPQVADRGGLQGGLLPDFLKPRTNAKSPFRVAVILVPGFALMSFASVIEPVRGANRLSGATFYEWELFAPEGGMVESNSGITVAAAPVSTLEQSHFDLVVVCAASHAEQRRFRTVEEVLRRLSRRNVALAAVSTGSFVLARAGLLDERRCTVHWDYADSFAEAFPDIALCNDLFVVDGSILTCAGATAALDMMLQLIGAHQGQDLARQISGQFLHGGIRAAADDQRRMLLGMGVTNSVVQKAVSLMEAAIEEPVPLTELTQRTGVSQRQLERLCKRYLGATPAQYYVQLRLERARRMLRQTDMSVAEVAIACGFVSLSHFAKVYRRHYGLSPREDRKAT